MIHEMRTYEIVPGKIAEYLEITAEHGRPARADTFGRLEGHFVAESGILDRIVTIWSYDDFAARAERRRELAKNERWTREFLPRIDPLILAKHTSVLNPMRPLASPSFETALYELRQDRARPGKAKAYVEALSPLVDRVAQLGHNVALWTTEVGDIDEIVHLWAFPTTDAWMTARRTWDESPALDSLRARRAEWIVEARSTLLRADRLSPMR